MRIELDSILAEMLESKEDKKPKATRRKPPTPNDVKT
jgi:hypothetical protein